MTSDRDHRHRRARHLRRQHRRPARDPAADAAVVVEDGRVGLDRAGRAGARPPTAAIDLGGRTAHPRLRRLPQPPRLRRRPVRRVRRPDDRQPVRRRRHRRAPSPRPGPPPTTSCAPLLGRAGRRDARPGHHHRRDQERVRAERGRRGPGAADRRRGHAGDHVPRRPRRPAGVARPTRGLPRPGHRRDARTPPPRTPAGSTCSASRRRRTPSTATRRGRCSRPAGRAGLELRVHGNQLGPGPGRPAGRRAGRGQRRPLHVPVRRRRRRPGRRRRHTVATLLPGVEFCTRSPYPDAARLLDAGVSIALATDCNPGTCYSSSMPFMIALAVREMGLTPAQALYAATVGRAQVPASPRHRPDHRRRTGRPGRDRRPEPPPSRLPSGRPAGSGARAVGHIAGYGREQPAGRRSGCRADDHPDRRRGRDRHDVVDLAAGRGGQRHRRHGPLDALGPERRAPAVVRDQLRGHLRVLDRPRVPLSPAAGRGSTCCSLVGSDQHVLAAGDRFPAVPDRDDRPRSHHRQRPALHRHDARPVPARPSP